MTKDELTPEPGKGVVIKPAARDVVGGAENVVVGIRRCELVEA